MEEIYDQAAAMLARWSQRVDKLKTVYPALSADFKKLEAEIPRLEQAIRLQKLKPILTSEVTEANRLNLVRQIAKFMDSTDELEAKISWLNSAEKEARDFFAEHPGSKPLMPAMKAAAEKGMIQLGWNAFQNIERAYNWVKKNPSEAEEMSRDTTKPKANVGSIEDSIREAYDRVN